MKPMVFALAMTLAIATTSAAFAKSSGYRTQGWHGFATRNVSMTHYRYNYGGYGRGVGAGYATGGG
jgi:hypothetical protein